MRRSAQSAVVTAALLLLLAASARADVELKKKTIDAYENYVRINHERLNAALSANQPFLWFESEPAAERREIDRQLRAGEVAIKHVRLDQNGKKIEIPDALVHHWLGAVFIPGAKVSDVLALVQDFNNYADVYKPEIMRARLLEKNGNDYRVYLRFLKKKMLTVVLNTDHHIQYEILGPKRALSRSWTTRVQEVQDPGKPGEKEKPVGKDSGFTWRLDTWWRFEERDGGTYVQCESVSLSRDIPFGLAWMLGPFVKSVPKESLTFSLGTTRTALLQILARANGNGRRPSPSN